MKNGKEKEQLLMRLELCKRESDLEMFQTKTLGTKEKANIVKGYFNCYEYFTRQGIFESSQ